MFINRCNAVTLLLILICTIIRFKHFFSSQYLVFKPTRLVIVLIYGTLVLIQYLVVLSWWKLFQLLRELFLLYFLCRYLDIFIVVLTFWLLFKDIDLKMVDVFQNRFQIGNNLTSFVIKHDFLFLAGII